MSLYLGFVAACIALALLPGPVVVLVIANGLARGAPVNTGSALHSIAIAWSFAASVGARRSSRTRGIAASDRIIISLKSSI
jgi:threonine/homoserine/homoserine lactone efflux protein